MKVINPQLVDELTKLIREWNEADRRAREFFHGWERKAVRLGLENGFYKQAGLLANSHHEFFGLSEECLHIEDCKCIQELGEAAFHAYKRGQFEEALTIARG